MHRRSRGIHRGALWSCLAAVIAVSAACGSTVTQGENGATASSGSGGSGNASSSNGGSGNASSSSNGGSGNASSSNGGSSNGGSGNGGSGNVGGGTAGSGGGCVSDDACDDGDACTHDACTNGACLSSPDDTGVPDDGNACTSDTCSAGVAHHTPLPVGTPCMAGLQNAPGSCDLAGDCQPGDCGPGMPQPPDPGPCLTIVGDPQTGDCLVVPLPDGTPLPDPPGDCLAAMCLGGQPASIADDSDLPADGKECTADLCTNGVPSHPPLAAGTPCGGGAFVCNATGDCGCQSNADCAAPTTCGGSCAMTQLVCGCCPVTCAALGRTCGAASDGCFNPSLACDTGTKNGQETDVDCGGPVSTCPTRCAQGKKCGATGDCQQGLTCVDGVCCDAPCSGACEACSGAKKGGGADGVCGPIKQGTDPDSECPAQAQATCGTNGFCSGAGACGLYPAGTLCAAASCVSATLTKADTCDGAGVCVDGGVVSCGFYKCNAQGTACLTMCATSADCQQGLTCIGGSCVINDGPCQSNIECASGFCIDGVCCNVACFGLCRACSAGKKGQGPNGTCGFIVAGADPDNECAGALTCNGAGACN